jgi:hypothetical protein
MSKDDCDHFLVRGIFSIKAIHEPPCLTQHFKADRQWHSIFMFYDNVEMLVL